MGKAALIARGRFGWGEGPRCELSWAIDDAKRRTERFADPFGPDCSCLEVEGVTMLVDSLRGLWFGSTGARVVHSETEPARSGCSACKEINGAWPVDSTGPGRGAEPGNAGTRLGTKFVAAFMKLE